MLQKNYRRKKNSGDIRTAQTEPRRFCGQAYINHKGRDQTRIQRLSIAAFLCVNIKNNFYIFTWQSSHNVGNSSSTLQQFC